MSATGRLVAPQYTLVDHHGRQVTEKSFPDHYQMIFFGFTHCRSVCPRALAKLSAALEALGPLADRIQPLYISVDPDRDTPEVMRDFLEGDHPRFTGLTGTPEAADAARSAFRVYAGRGADPEDPDGYAVPHTALTYLLDTDASYLAHLPDHLDTHEVITRIREFVRRPADATT